MKFHNSSTLIAALLVVSPFGWCNESSLPDAGNTNALPPGEVKKPAPARLPVNTEKEVTFYPTYGYKREGGWNIRLRGWVHEDREHLSGFVAQLATVKKKCSGIEMKNFRARTDDFGNDDKSLETVVIKFNQDDKPYTLKTSNVNGIVVLDLVLSEENAGRLLENQGSTNAWLSFRAVSRGHTGLGRVRLIEPEGVSLVSDIDDTIKVTEIPAGRDTVLRNTFCRDFKPAQDMAKMYRELGDISFHYVSGGPEQLFGPLYDFLIAGEGSFPEGTFHLKFFPKNLLSGETRRNLRRFAASSLDATFAHKIKEITTLMERFPKRQFILVGDSGEVDPEVYNEILKNRPGQVKEIWIRDVVNDADPNANPYRLEGMKVIRVEPPVCVEEGHFQSLSVKMKQLHAGREYKRNTAPPCDK
jgi:hypothetical protein